MAEIGEVGLGRQRSPNNHAGPHMRRYVRAANITWAGWDLTDVKEMNFDPADFQRFQLRVGDVLLNEGSGSAKEVGKPAIWRGEIENCCFQNTLIRVQPVGCSSEYLYYYFRWLALSGGVAPETQGVNIHHIGRAGVANCRLPVPPLPEQCRIVARIEALFARTCRARADLESIRQLATKHRRQQAVSAFGSDEALAWPLRRLDDIIADARVGLVRAKSEQHERQGVPYIRMQHYDECGRWNIDAVTYVEATAQELHLLQLKAGDLLFNTRNSVELVGKMAIWPEGKNGYVYNNNLLRIRLIPAVNPDYVRWALLASSAAEALESAKSATTSVAAIYQRVLMRVQLPVPSGAVQDRIAMRLSRSVESNDRAEHEASRTLTLLDRLEQSILARAFRGELVPQDPAEAPASVVAIDVPRPARARRSRAA